MSIETGGPSQAEINAIKAVKFSSYNRQHPLETGEDGRLYDPLEKNFDRYQALLTKPATVSEQTMRELPLSAGILGSYATFVHSEQKGREITKLFERRHQWGKYNGGHITDVGDYLDAVRELQYELRGSVPAAEDTPPPAGPTAAVRQRL